jgi:hypothetical protein
MLAYFLPAPLSQRSATILARCPTVIPSTVCRYEYKSQVVPGFMSRAILAMPAIRPVLELLLSKL